MIAFYAQIKWVHVAAVICSISLFALRGALVQSGRGHWARGAALRYLSYTIDTTLLTAALMLFTLLPSAYFANGWLLLKLILLPIYIVLGVFALRTNGSARQRLLSFIAALCVFGYMASIARAHHPLGLLNWL